MHTATVVTLVGGGVLLVVGGAAWFHSRSKSASGTGNDMAANAAQAAATSAGKNGTKTDNADVSKTQKQINNATALFNAGLSAYSAAKAAASSPGK